MAAVLLGAAGCPHAFGRGGTIDRAVYKDIIENLRANDCNPEKVREVCGDEFYDACMEECEDPSE
jgi:hypothetical protein